jgi:hypothetical protein
MGTVIGNTQTVNYGGYCWIWKQIQWDDGLVGYSQDNYLVALSPNLLVQADYHGNNMSVGSTTDADAVTLRGLVTSPDAKSVLLEVEVRRVGEAFTGVKTGESGLVPSGTTVSICTAGLGDYDFHWQARTRDSSGNTTPWRSFGDNSESQVDFSIRSTQCAVCTSSASGANFIQIVDNAACSPSLSVALSASPNSGTAPLNDVDLTANVSGSATGAISYTFYCNASDSDYAARYVAITENPKTALNVCDYTTPGTYTARVVVARGSNSAEGSVTITVTQSPTQAPTVTTSGATNVTQGSATLNLSVDPHGSDTAVWFDWGTSSTSFCCSTSQQTVLGSAGATLLSMSIGGLSCDTTYYYRARAQNPGGSATGSTLSFRTNSCGGTSQTIELVADPSFEAGNNAWWVSSPAFYIGALSFPRTGSKYAYLSNANGTAGDNLQGGFISPLVTIPANATSAELRFWHSVTTQETTTSTIFDKVGAYLVKSGNQTTLLSTISNLDNSGTVYRERRVTVPSSFYGQNVQIFFSGSTDSSLPTVFRIDDVTLTVTTPVGGAPSVTTQAADQISSSSARLNMTVNPNGASTSVWFNLEAGDSTPDNETEHISIGSGTSNEAASISAFNLQCGTLYYFQAKASNPQGAAQGSVQSFTTASCGSAPEADTDPAVNITATSATLTADVNPHGLTTQAWFVWGASVSFGQETPHVSVGSGNGFTNFTQAISGLSCGTTYYFQNRASNSAGQASGATLSFTTNTCTPTLPMVSISAVDTTATEAGLTTGTFRLSRTGNLSQPLYLAYSVSGTASYGEDYEELTSVFFPAGSASIDITVQPRQDTLVEGDETVVLTIQPQSTYDVSSPGSAAVTITSDDVNSGCTVGIVKPVGNETWVKGLPHTISWNASSGCLDFTVYLKRPDLSEIAISSFVDSHQFTWTPAAWIVPGAGLQVEVVGYGQDGYGISALSNTFTLVNPAVLPITLFEDDVESDEPLNWWAYGWGVTDFTSHSLSHSRADSPAFYGNDENTSLITPDIDLSGRNAVYLTFWHRFDLADFDSVNVWVLPAGGDWTFMRGFTGIQQDWQPVTLDLSQFVGSLTMQVAFQLISDESLTADGWYLDDINIYEPEATDFYTLNACRVIDTRQGLGALSTGNGKTFPVAGTCGIPANARAVSVNVTAVSPTSSGNMRLFPSDRLQPNTSTINFEVGKNRANNALLGLSVDGRLAAVMGGIGQVDLVVDVNGYFTDTHPLVGTWSGTVAGYTSTLVIQGSAEAFTLHLSMAGANDPVEQLSVLSVSETQLTAYRPADNAELRMFRQSGAEECLVGEYVEDGSSRPISLCKTP